MAKANFGYESQQDPVLKNLTPRKDSPSQVFTPTAALEDVGHPYIHEDPGP